jgi:MFS transporter, PAT family, beta-lactamase induction signal transducer AmpG
MKGTIPLRYATFGMLYFAEGAILSYFTSLNAIYLRSFSLTMSQVGLFSAIAVSPMILKVFIGMLSDRVDLFGLGHRKPYIILGLLLQTGGILVFPYIHPVHSFGLMVLTGFLVVSGMALYDTCTDGFALDTTPVVDEGKVQGIMVAGRAFGVVVIAGLLGIISHQANWTWVFMALASMSLLPLPMVLMLKEPAKSPEAKFNWKAFRILKRRDIIALGMLGALFTLITNGSNELVNPFLRETFGISYMMAGFYTALWGVGVILGGLTGGRFTDRFGDRKALIGAMFTSLAAVTLLACITGPALAWPLVFLFGIAYGYYETAYFATSMAVTDIRIAASMFSILMALANIGSSIGMIVSGSLSDRIGYRWTFALLGGLNLLVIPLLPMIFRKKNAAIHEVKT